jgi:hypothetical protein
MKRQKKNCYNVFPFTGYDFHDSYLESNSGTHTIITRKHRETAQLEGLDEVHTGILNQ